MRVLQITNWHRNGGGLDFIARTTASLLRDAGHDVVEMGHDSHRYEASLTGKLEAAGAGIYSPAALREIRELLQESPPDVAHVHEVYPYHSPWVIRELDRAGVPVVMTCHDFRLSCPVATHMHKGRICTRCAGGNTAWCALKNCRGNVAESTAFAIRAATANIFGLYRKHVTTFIAPSNFVRDLLVREKRIAADRFRVVPNLILPADSGPRGGGDYVAFVGRIRPEKGIGTLLDAAALCDVPVRIAGGPIPDDIRRDSPNTVTWLGHLEGVELAAFYRNARFLVVPSFFEPFGLVVGEAMLHGLPVIGANSGALPELIQPDENGMLFTTGDAQELADKLIMLWENPALCRRLSKTAAQYARQRFCPGTYCDRIVEVYEDAIMAAANQSYSRPAKRAREAKAKP